MAQKRHLTQYDSSGNKREIYLNDDEVLLEGGQTLRGKLAEMQEDIEEASEQGGIQQETDPTVPSWAKQPAKPTYTPQEVGAVPSQGYVEYTQAEKEKLDALPTASELSTELGEKANTDDVYDKQTVDQKVANAGKVKSVSVNDEQPVQPDQNGNVHLEIEGGEGKSAYQSYLETTTDNPKKTEAEWVASLKGPKGDTGNVVVSDGVAQIGIINDLETGGEGDALSAEMGKRLKALIDAYESRIDALEESGAALVSVEGTTLVISRMNEPVVIVGDLTKDALTAVAGGESVTSDFFVSGRNLEGNIGIALSDATNFSVVPTTLVPVDGKVQTTMVSVKFNPAAGLAAGSTHSCTVTVTYGGVAKKTMTIIGTVAASASVSLNPAILTLRAAQGDQTNGTITLQGVALSGDVTLALTGTGLSFDDDAVTTTKTVSRADAENGTAITIYYTAGASDVNGSLTATSGTATASATVNGVVSVPLAVGSYFDVPVAAGGSLRYTLLTASTVSVKKGSTNPVGTAANPLVIPSQVSDADASAVYDSSGNAISASGMTYNVTEIPLNGFEALRTIESLVISEGVTSIGQGAFNNCTSIKEISLPSSLATLSDYALRSTSLTEIELPACSVGSFAISSISTLTKVIMNGTKIRNNAFSGVTSINELHFNDCETAAASWTGTAFPSCTQFTDGATYPKVYVNSVTPPAIPNNIPVFPDDNGVIKAKLYVPSGSEAAYRAANVWSKFEFINDSTN